mmetsp:Transcript_23964/g.34847  ORF Transcript_23964/g.34847 Transcript_23964/m.34847 type:complete len:87 (-) Transcript_23964:1189-1449(-)
MENKNISLAHQHFDSDKENIFTNYAISPSVTVAVAPSGEIDVLYVAKFVLNVAKFISGASTTSSFLPPHISLGENGQSTRERTIWK